MEWPVLSTSFHASFYSIPENLITTFKNAKKLQTWKEGTFYFMQKNDNFDGITPKKWIYWIYLNCLF